MPVGENIRKARQRLGLSTEEMARLIPGVTRSTLNRWELGQNEPRVSDVEKLARALQTNPAALCGWTKARDD